MTDCTCDVCETCHERTVCATCRRCARCTFHREGCPGCPSSFESRERTKGDADGTRRMIEGLLSIATNRGHDTLTVRCEEMKVLLAELRRLTLPPPTLPVIGPWGASPTDPDPGWIGDNRALISYLRTSSKEDAYTRRHREACALAADTMLDWIYRADEPTTHAENLTKDGKDRPSRIDPSTFTLALLASALIGSAIGCALGVLLRVSLNLK